VLELGTSRHRSYFLKTRFSNRQQVQRILKKRTGIVGEGKQSIVSEDPLLLEIVIALPDHDFAGEVDWLVWGKCDVSPQLNH
jgi:hypothetical protein